MSDRPNDAGGIFDLFREFEYYDIEDPNGRTATVALRALDWYENQQLIEGLEPVRLQAKKKFEDPDHRTQLTKDLEGFSDDMVFDQIIMIEKATVSQNTDLSPGITDDMTPEKKKKLEEEALAKWESERRVQIKELGRPSAVTHLIELQIRSLIMVTVADKLVTASLVSMVQQPLCPECGVVAARADSKFFPCQCGKWPKDDQSVPRFRPAVSGDEKAPNYIGRLMPPMRRQLGVFRNRFLTGQSEKNTRATAESGSFLPSGPSPSESAASPGATTETPSGSQPELLPSTP